MGSSSVAGSAKNKTRNKAASGAMSRPKQSAHPPVSKTTRAGQGTGRGRRKTLSNASLLHLTRTVAMSACPADRMTVSQRACNAARGVAGHPECPEASYIVRRLGYSWPEFLKLALTEEGNTFATLASHT